MPRFTPGQTVVLPGGRFATVVDLVPRSKHVMLREEGSTVKAIAWLDRTYTRAEALRDAHRLIARLADDVEDYALADLVEGMAAQIELARQACDRGDALAGAAVVA